MPGFCRCFLHILKILFDFRGADQLFKKSAHEEQTSKPRLFSDDLEQNIQLLRIVLQDCDDVIFRRLQVSGKNAMLIYDEVMIDRYDLNEHILEASLQDTSGGIFKRAKEKTWPVGEISKTNDLNECVQKVFFGNAAVLVEGSPQAWLLEINQWPERKIDNPANEPSIRGAKDSFVETLSSNASLLRRRLVTPDFKMVSKNLGQLAQKRIKVCYLASIVHPKLLDEVFHRLSQINVDCILNNSVLEELIEDEPYSPFPTMLVTERPDKTEAFLLEGRVVILQDDSPFALILPVSFMQFFHSVDDYYNRYFYGTFIRFTRLVALFLTVYLPSFYVAVTTFHQEMLPTKFLTILQEQREGVPFPAVFEAVMMGFAFEILREAGLRLPRAVGQAVSIVGALIIGEAAVQAQLVAPSMVIVTAVTAIASFTFPTQGMNEPILLLRLVLTMVSGILGLWGILILSLLLLGHLASLRSFGVPYLSPLGPLVKEDLDDFLVRMPLWQMKKRPKQSASRNLVRQGKRPSPNRKAPKYRGK